MRSVKSILRIALREAKQETAFSEADSHAYEDAFNYYIDMLEEFEAQGIVTGYEIPASMNDDIGAGNITNIEMASLLVMRIAPFFSYQTTMAQNGKASRSNSNLLARQEIPEMKKNFVPSTYPYYDRNPISCCDDDDCCDDDEAEYNVEM